MKPPLVCVFAHPDDEAFASGGTIAKFAKERDVYLICVTKGNAKSASDQESLGGIRKQELLQAAAILGVKQVDFLGFNDGELCNNRYHEIASKIEEKIWEYKPNTLLTFEITGVTGHLDHIAVSLITSFVFKKIDFVKTLLYYCEDKRLVDALAPNYFIYVPPGHSTSEVHEVVDVSDVWEDKLKAIRAHKSQKHDGEATIKFLEKFHKTSEYFLKLEKPYSD